MFLLLTLNMQLPSGNEDFQVLSYDYVNLLKKLPGNCFHKKPELKISGKLILQLSPW